MSDRAHVPADAAPAAQTAPAARADDPARPLVSMLLIAYNQERVVAGAIRGALAQTWEPLEIVVSDDASTDGTWAAIQAAVRDYRGPHRLVVRRNDVNEGISAHLSRVAALARGELLVIAAGDDISVPERCARLVSCWLAHDRRPDLIASDLADLDDAGNVHHRIAPDDLGAWRSFDDWRAKRPWLIGAAHAWSRRMIERFGPMAPGTAAEDQIMMFRALAGGGALSLREPLVLYRRGGLSRKKRFRSVAEMLARKDASNRYSLSELAQLQRDADRAGLGDAMRAALAAKLARERFIRAMFDAPGLRARIARLAASRGAAGIPFGLKVRMFLYTTCPFVYAAPLWAKRTFAKRR